MDMSECKLGTEVNVESYNLSKDKFEVVDYGIIIGAKKVGFHVIPVVRLSTGMKRTFHPDWLVFKG